MNTKVFSATLAAGFALSAPMAQAACGEISITEMDWASSAVITHIADFLLTQGYGCSVKLVPSSTTPAMASMAETGQPDVLTELWTNSSPVYEELRSAGKVVELTNVLSDGGVEGWWLPKYLVDAHPELATIEGVLANPTLVGSSFNDCPSGWACDVVDMNNIRALGMEEAGIKRFQHGSGETLATTLAAAYTDKKPWFGYYWAPTSVLGKYPMVQVKMPAYDADAHKCNGDPNCAAPVASAYPVAKVVTAVAPGLPEREPDAVAFLTKMSFTNDQMGAVLAWQEENKASYQEAAAYFISNYKETWAGWLNPEASEKLAPLLQ